MAEITPYLLMQKVIHARKSRGLTPSVLAKQARLRLDYLVELESKTNSDMFELSELRQAINLAKFLRLDFTEKQLLGLLEAFEQKNHTSTELQLPSRSEQAKTLGLRSWVLLTAANFNFVFLVGLIALIISLVGLPVYLVVRPAEIEWIDEVTYQTVVVTEKSRLVQARALRAKSVFLGGQEIFLKNGILEVEFPKPEKPVAVPLLLINYFNFETKYELVVRPA